VSKGPSVDFKRYAAVIGAGNCSAEVAELARSVGRGLAEAGFVVVTGGLTGVMDAAARGVSEVGGSSVGVLPDLDRSRANPHSTYTIVSGVGWARNLAVVASADVVIAVGGEWGTLSEIGHAAQMGKPIVLLRSWRLDHELKIPETIPGIHTAGSPGEAVALATGLAGSGADGSARGDTDGSARGD
jgi:uncharacterized protein (TIGR00725 family)